MAIELRFTDGLKMEFQRRNSTEISQNFKRSFFRCKLKVIIHRKSNGLERRSWVSSQTGTGTAESHLGLRYVFVSFTRLLSEPSWKITQTLWQCINIADFLNHEDQVLY